MTPEQIKVIEENTDLVESIQEGYSGRCMYGETTHAIIVNQYDRDEAEKFLIENNIPYRLDNMGFDWVLY